MKAFRPTVIYSAYIKQNSQNLQFWFKFIIVVCYSAFIFLVQCRLPVSDALSETGKTSG